MQDMPKIIQLVRRNSEALAEYGRFLSTSELLILYLGLGTPAAMRNLERTMYPTIPEAWQRIGADGQAIVLRAWLTGPG